MIFLSASRVLTSCQGFANLLTPKHSLYHDRTLVLCMSYSSRQLIAER